ncbi:MAG: hypothetical protein ABIK43_05085, partial [candidate division WOR-3 bacterium]
MILTRFAIWATLVAALAYAAGPDVIWSSRLDFGGDDLALGIDSRDDMIAVTGWFTDSTSTAGCLTVRYNQNGETLWSRTFVTGLDDYGCATAIDNEGNIYVAGYSTIVSDRRHPFPGLSAAAAFQDNDAFILKYDPAGELKWSRTITGCAALGVAVDDSGNCFVSGFDGDIATSSDLWCAKFSSVGESLWSSTYDFGEQEIGYRACRLPGHGFACCNFV